MICGAIRRIMNSNDVLRNSVLAEISALPLRNMETVKSWRETLVVAPHPDDESLGCGGAIALLRRFEIPVNVLVMSDGTLSHPNSRQFPAPVLRDLRESEMLAALAALGVSANQLAFLRFKDRSVPGSEDKNFAAAVSTCESYLRKIKPRTVLLPWRRDPHPDHRASSRVMFEALKNLGEQPQILEYPIWIWELAATADAPRSDEVRAFRLDIKTVSRQKQTAIGAHKSQTTDLIKDDPHGFRLTPEILENFAAPYEIYLESIQPDQ